MVGNDENSSGAWMNSEVIRIRIDSVIEIARNRSSTIEAGEDQHDQDGEDAERQREIAALQDGPDFAETRKSASGRPALTCRDIDHRCCFPRVMPVAAPNVCAAAEGPRFESEAPH